MVSSGVKKCKGLSRGIKCQVVSYGVSGVKGCLNMFSVKMFYLVSFGVKRCHLVSSGVIVSRGVTCHEV